MNEQIRELLKQASKLANADDNKDFDRKFDMIVAEKFAELIVQECAGVCEQYRGTEWGKAAECIGDSIREHFEVEE